MADPDATVAVITGAREICGAWGLTSAETEALVAGDLDRAAAVIRCAELLGVYSTPLPEMWFRIPNRNPAIGGTPERPLRPLDHALATQDGLWDVLRLLEGYAQGW